MICNVEVLLVISADTEDDADALATHIVNEAAETYGPASHDAGNTPAGVVASASVESVVMKRRAA